MMKQSKYIRETYQFTQEEFLEKLGLKKEGDDRKWEVVWPPRADDFVEVEIEVKNDEEKQKC